MADRFAGSAWRNVATFDADVPELPTRIVDEYARQNSWLSLPWRVTSAAHARWRSPPRAAVVAILDADVPDGRPQEQGLRSSAASRVEPDGESVSEPHRDSARTHDAVGRKRRGEIQLGSQRGARGIKHPRKTLSFRRTGFTGQSTHAVPMVLVRDPLRLYDPERGPE